MTLRPLQPTSNDMKRWRRLVREARRAVATPNAPGGDLRAAATAAEKAVAPSRELLLSTCSPLIRLALRYAAAGDLDRELMRGELATLAERLAEAVAPDDPPPAGAVAMPVPHAAGGGAVQPGLPFRRDIDG